MQVFLVLLWVVWLLMVVSLSRVLLLLFPLLLLLKDFVLVLPQIMRTKEAEEEVLEEEVLARY